MSKPATPLTIKPTKTLPLILIVIYVVLALVILVRADTNIVWLYAGIVTILLFALLADMFTGYLQLSNDSLTKKNLFGSQTIKISEIKEVSTARHILGPSQTDIGNTRNKVSIVSSAFKRNEFRILMRQLQTKLKSVNPKRAKDLQQVVNK